MFYCLAKEVDLRSKTSTVYQIYVMALCRLSIRYVKRENTTLIMSVHNCKIT